MESCIYLGEVKHIRYRPARNAFTYSLFMLYLDLGELEEIFRDRLLWSIGRPNLAWLKREDHFGDPQITIADAVRNLVEEKTGRRPEGPIRMLAHLRYFGHCFNPATFYYCYDRSGSKLENIIVEIHNTPWGEVFCYVLDEKMNLGSREERQFAPKKVFHVSPFIDMDVEYRWNFNEPGEVLRVHMEDHQAGELLFAADLELARKEISGPSLAQMLAGYPPMTVKVVTAIYWQALLLKLKGVPFYSHPEKRTPAEGHK